MISYSRSSQESLPISEVKIIGLGGAGLNILEQLTLEKMDEVDLLALNTDIRSLKAITTEEKIQLGMSLTRGLGTGGDPELGQQAILEVENEVRAALRGKRILFLCVGLGGGTGSGAAPILARIAREEGNFVVVFATMPFSFEGHRRRSQADAALNQLAVLSNALVTFDNKRMSELVLEEQGIHEAFYAANRMISESIKAVIRLVVRPGLINVGLDDLMTALRTTRSRCLFGSGMAEGRDRATRALDNALNSPLLDQGALLKRAKSVLVHLSGGESLSLFEIEQLMSSLDKHIPQSAQILFGAAIDPKMGDHLSITLISSLPEEFLSDSLPEVQAVEAVQETNLNDFVVTPFENFSAKQNVAKPSMALVETETSLLEMPLTSEPEEELLGSNILFEEKNANLLEFEESNTLPFAEVSTLDEKGVPVSSLKSEEVIEPENSIFPKKTPESRFLFPKVSETSGSKTSKHETEENEASEKKVILPKPKLETKTASPQSELSFETLPKGRFEGGSPNLFEGEDLDLPPFLRKKST